MVLVLKQCLAEGDLDAILKRFNYANEIILHMFVTSVK